MNADFWRGRHVLITGHTGFKGSWLSLWLERLGANVTGISLKPPTDPNLFEAASVGVGLQDSRLDVRDSEAVMNAFEQARPSIVFHLAAQPLVRASYELPLETFSTNVMGTAHVLEAMRRCGTATAAVIVTSDKCYENREIDHAYAECEPLGGHDPYSSSKACAELVASAYRRSFLSAESGTVATVRAGNVIGGGDWAADRLVPDLMRAFAAGKSAPIRNPAAVRPWQHVLEPLHGYLLLAEKLDEHGDSFAEAWNLGPDLSDTRSVEEVVSMAATEWGGEACWCRDESTHPHEATLLRLDASKARARLGWQPYWTVETAVRETVRWYKEFARGADMRELTLAQIESYSEEKNARC